MSENGTWYGIRSQAIDEQMDLLTIPQRMPEPSHREPAKSRRWGDGYSEAILLIGQFQRKEVIPVKQQFVWYVQENLSNGTWKAEDLNWLLSKARDIRSEYKKFSGTIKPSSNDPQFQKGFEKAFLDKRESIWRALFDFKGFKNLHHLYLNWQEGEKHGLGHKVNTEENSQAVLKEMASVKTAQTDDFQIDFDQDDISDEDVKQGAKYFLPPASSRDALLRKIGDLERYAQSVQRDEGQDTIPINPYERVFSPDPRSGKYIVKSIFCKGRDLNILYIHIPEYGSPTGTNLQYISTTQAMERMPWLIDMAWSTIKEMDVSVTLGAHDFELIFREYTPKFRGEMNGTIDRNTLENHASDFVMHWFSEQYGERINMENEHIVRMIEEFSGDMIDLMTGRTPKTETEGNRTGTVRIAQTDDIEFDYEPSEEEVEGLVREFYRPSQKNNTVTAPTPEQLDPSSNQTISLLASQIAWFARKYRRLSGNTRFAVVMEPIQIREEVSTGRFRTHPVQVTSITCNVSDFVGVSYNIRHSQVVHEDIRSMTRHYPSVIAAVHRSITDWLQTMARLDDAFANTILQEGVFERSAASMPSSTKVAQTDDFPIEFDDEPSDEDVEMAVKTILTPKNPGQTDLPNSELLRKADELRGVARRRGQALHSTKIDINPWRQTLSPPGDSDNTYVIKSLRLTRQDVSICFDLIPNDPSGTSLNEDYLLISEACTDMPWLVEEAWNLCFQMRDPSFALGNLTQRELPAEQPNSILDRLLVDYIEAVKRPPAPGESLPLRLNEDYATGFIEQWYSLNDPNTRGRPQEWFRTRAREIVTIARRELDLTTPDELRRDFAIELIRNQRLRLGLSSANERIQAVYDFVQGWMARQLTTNRSAIILEREDVIGIVQLLALGGVETRGQH